MNLCETCKFWKEAGEYQNWKRFGFGECSKMPMFWDATGWDDESNCDERVLLPEYKDQLAFVQDGSDCKAYLIVSPKFGCVLHEPHLTPH